MNNQTITALSEIEKLRDQALMLSKEAHYGQALILLKLALATYKDNAYLDESVKADILDELANISFCRGDYAQAKLEYEEALKTLEHRWYAEHASLAPILDHLAQMYIAQGNFKSAQALCQQSLRIKEKTLAPSNCHVLESMRMLAIVEGELGNYSQAEELLKKGMAILEPSTIGPVEEFIYALANVYEKQGKNEEAEALYKQAIVTYLQRSGRHQRLAHCVNDFARFLLKHGRNKDAESLYQQTKFLTESTGTIEEDNSLPNSQYYQRVVYPVTIFH